MKKNAEELKYEIKTLILDTLKINDVQPEDIQDDEPLFGAGNTIGLDSIDAIEIIMALQKKYDVRLDDQNLARVILTSVNTIAGFISGEKGAGS